LYERAGQNNPARFCINEECSQCAVGFIYMTHNSVRVPRISMQPLATRAPSSCHRAMTGRNRRRTGSRIFCAQQFYDATFKQRTANGMANIDTRRCSEIRKPCSSAYQVYIRRIVKPTIWPASSPKPMTLRLRASMPSHVSQSTILLQTSGS
jgi:hypothetical protein